jgi:ELWxxDGT repeat protein
LRRSLLAACSAAAVLSIPAVATAAPYEVTRVPTPDLGTLGSSPAPGPNYPAAATSHGVVFTADDQVHGNELWFTDGTTAGTHLVRDITPGADGTQIDSMAGLGDRVVLPAGPDHDLWVSDGTAAGTQQLAHVMPDRLTVAGSVAYFFSFPDGGLWRTDGTEAGTGPVPGSLGLPSDTSMVPVGAAVYGWDGARVWRADANGVTTVDVALPAGTDAQEIRPIGAYQGDLLVAAGDADTGYTVWRTGTTPARKVLNATLGSLPAASESGGRLFVTADADGIFAGDATPAGMRSLGSGVFTHSPFVTVGGRQYFAGSASSYNGYDATGRLFQTDGTPEGTKPVFDTPETYSFFEPIALGGRVLYFDGVDTDSFGSGFRLRSYTPGAAAPESLGTPQRPLIPFGSQAFMVGLNGDKYGTEPWVTDGTVAGTKLVKDVNATPIVASVRAIGSVGDSALLGLWGDDGLDRGTYRASPDGSLTRLSSALLQDESSDHLLGGARLFAGDDNGTSSLWRSDGTPAGTYTLGGGTDPFAITVIGQQAWFSAATPETGTELWRTDGTPAGTRMVADIGPGSDGASPRGFVQLGDNVLFSANPNGPSQLWRTDAAGQHVARIGTMEIVGTPLVVGNAAYVLDVDGGLWRTDGTDAGTRRVAQFAGYPQYDPLAVTATGRIVAALDGVTWGYDPTTGHSEQLLENPEWATLLSVEGHVLLSTGDGLLATDGTAAGTHAFPQDDPLPGNVRYARGTHGGWLTTRDGDGNPVIAHTDGTDAGTTRVTDAPNLGDPHDVPNPVAVGDDLVYFGAGPQWLVWVRPGGGGTTPVTPVTPPAVSTPAVSTPTPAAQGGTPAAAPEQSAPSETPAGAPTPTRAAPVTPRGLTLRVTGGRKGRWTVAGTLRVAEPSASRCNGSVAVTVRRGGSAAASRTLKLDQRCRFHGTITAKPNGRRLVFHAVFAGTADVAAAQSRSVGRP